MQHDGDVLEDEHHPVYVPVDPEGQVDILLRCPLREYLDISFCPFPEVLVKGDDKCDQYYKPEGVPLGPKEDHKPHSHKIMDFHGMQKSVFPQKIYEF